MIIDAKNLILGRMSSFVAKKALLGEKIDIVNCENSVVVGKRKEIFGRYNKMNKRGVHSKGPIIFKMPDRFVKRTIRGMIPYKTAKGRTAYKSINCHIGFPDILKKEKIESLDNINISKNNTIDYINVKEICNHLGGFSLN